MTKFKIDTFYLVILLYILYYMQGIIYPSGSFISQFVILLFICIGLYSYVRLLLKRNNPFFVKVFVAFFLLIVASWLFFQKQVIGIKYEAIGVVSTLGQFKTVSSFILAFFISYRYALSGKSLSYNGIAYLGIIFVLLSIIRFFYNNEMMLNETGSEFFTNNMAYMVLACFPYFPFIIRKTKLISIVLFVICISIIFSGSKRGALLSLFVVCLFYVFYYMKKHRISLKLFMGITICIVGCAYFIFYLYSSNEYLLMRMDRMHDSGIGTREIAYNVLFNYWLSEENLLKILFGNGMSYTIEVWGNYAHNDWLELLINGGLLSVILYFLLFVSIMKYVSSVVISFECKVSVYLSLIIWFMKSIFSMGYSDMGNIIFILLLGLILGDVQYKKLANEKGVVFS